MKKVKLKMGTEFYKELTPVFPHGLVVAGQGMAPFILFKDQSQQTSFPVWLPYNPAKMQHNISETKLYRAPGLLSTDILKFFNYKVDQCLFTQVKSGVQWAKVSLKPLLKSAEGPEKQLFIDMLAYEAFSLATLDQEVQYFATEDFMKDTREGEIKDKNHGDYGKEKSLRKHGGQKYLM